MGCKRTRPLESDSLDVSPSSGGRYGRGSGAGGARCDGKRPLLWRTEGDSHLQA